MLPYDVGDDEAGVLVTLPMLPFVDALIRIR
jgi:hypothetical protein